LPSYVNIKSLNINLCLGARSLHKSGAEKSSCFERAMRR